MVVKPVSVDFLRWIVGLITGDGWKRGDAVSERRAAFSFFLRFRLVGFGLFCTVGLGPLNNKIIY